MKKNNMKKIGIVTIIDNENCGNRLQNYALQETLKKLEFDVYTLKNDKLLNSKEHFFINYLKYIKKCIRTKLFEKNTQKSKFNEFNRIIKFSKNKITCKSININNKYDYFIAGSDQIWKPTRKRMSYIDLLGFASPEKRISYAASFGIEKIEEKYNNILKKELPMFKAISVREEAGKKIIKDIVNIDNVEVLLDPTMLLNKNDWEKLEEKPKNIIKDKFIFSYFLGNENVEQIDKKFKSNDYQFIDFYKNDYGPKEFIYLIHNAEYIFTDSFHATVFSIIFNKNFYIIDRKQDVTNNNMNSRIDTLLKKFNLEKRRINSFEKIDTFNNNINYQIDEIMKVEQRKSLQFLKDALDIC